MTRTFAHEAGGSTIRVEDDFSIIDLRHLVQLLAQLQPGAKVVVDLTHARNVDAHALALLQREVLRLLSLGREVRLRGITDAQSRFLALVHGKLVPAVG